MIITLTPNPSVDRTLQVEQLRFNEILRPGSVRLDWGGKGFYVSRWLRVLGEETLALAWVGGGAGTMLEDGLNKLGIHTDFVWVEEETRTNTIAMEADSEWYIRLNEPGPHIPESAIQALFEKARAYASQNDIWVASGSLPPEVPDNFYAKLIGLLKAKGVRVFFNSNDNALRLGVEAAPWLVNPDASQAEQYVGMPIRNYEDAKRAVLHFLLAGVQYFAISVGGLGVLLASQHEMILATPPKLAIKNVTGAGDALMAALVYGFQRQMPLMEIARWGAAYAAVVVNLQDPSQVCFDDITTMLNRVDARSVTLM